MQRFPQEGKLTRRDARVAQLLTAAPWLALAAATLPVPLLCLFLYFTVTQDAAVYLLMAGSSLAVGAFIGVFIALLLVLYRKRWHTRLRDKLAADGVTASEISWFFPELKTAEKESLSRIESEHPALGDAYRETLAARIMATRLLNTTKRELLQVRRRINKAQQLQGVDTERLRADLLSDKEHLEDVRMQVERRQQDAEAQLQAIEAVMARLTIYPKTDIAMQRLDAAQQEPPLALEAARMEQAAREMIESMVKSGDVRTDQQGTVDRP
jgi:hypothetical protein